MDFMAWLTIVSGIISILAFVFSVWIWLRSDLKVQEISRVIEAMHDMAGSIIWEASAMRADGTESLTGQLERVRGIALAIRAVSTKYTGEHTSYRETEIGTLMQRGVIWSHSMLSRLETSREVKEIWLSTDDLEPDLSDPKTITIVSDNIRQAKIYVYFYPSSLEGATELCARLRRNVGGDRASLASRIRFIEVADSKWNHLFPAAGNNSIIFFKDKIEFGTDLIFEEIRLTKIDERGLFWQEHTRKRGRKILEELTALVMASR